MCCSAPCWRRRATAAPASTSSPLISDALHNGGTGGFYFLPPMVPRPASFGDVIAAANPTVSIERIDAHTGQPLAQVATYTSTSGPNGVHLKLHARNGGIGDDDDTDTDGNFVVRWDTGAFSLPPDSMCRVHVRVPARPPALSRELAFADVSVVLNRAEFRGVDSNQYVPLIDGKVLRRQQCGHRGYCPGPLDAHRDRLQAAAAGADLRLRPADLRPQPEPHARRSLLDHRGRPIVSYEWDLSGLSPFAPSATGPTATLASGDSTYGTHPIALRVTSQSQQQSTYICNVVVKPPPHWPHPTAGGTSVQHVYTAHVGAPPCTQSAFGLVQVTP